MAGPITIQCPSCDGKLKLPSRSVEGKRVRCPKCEHAFVVQLPPEQGDELLDNLDGIDEYEDYSSESDSPEDFDDAFSPKPRRASGSRKAKPVAKKKGKRKSAQGISPVLMAGGGLLAVLLLVGLAVAVLPRVFKSGDGNKVDLTYLPHDSELIVHVDWHGAWNSPFIQEIVNRPHVKQQLDLIQQMSGKNEMGFADVDSITFGIAGVSDAAAGAAPDNWVFVLRSRRVLNRKEFENMPMWRKSEHQGETYYVQNNPMMSLSAYSVDRYTWVMGSDVGVRGAIERGSRSVRRPEFDFIDPDQHLIVAFVPRNRDSFASAPHLAAAGDQPENIRKAADLFKRELAGTFLGVKFGQDIALQARANCATPAGAGEAKGAVDQLLAEAKTKFAEAKSNPAAMMFGQILQPAEATLNSATLSQENQAVVLRAQVPASIKDSFSSLASLMPLMGGMGGGFGNPGMGAFNPGMGEMGDEFPGGEFPNGNFPGGNLPTPPNIGGFTPPGGFPMPPQMPQHATP